MQMAIQCIHKILKKNKTFHDHILVNVVVIGVAYHDHIYINVVVIGVPKTYHDHNFVVVKTHFFTASDSTTTYFLS